jgi:hypothetical protein
VANIYFSGGSIRFEVESEDEIRRLREALGQLLQVNQLCVLIGSGASFHLGSPRIRDVDSSVIETMCDAAEVPLDDEALELLQAIASSSADLEALLGQLSASLNYAAAFGKDRVDIAGLTPSRDVVSTLFGSINVGLAMACDLPRSGVTLDPPYDTDPWWSHREFFRRLIGSRRPDAPRARVFTTNYDTVIERALDDCGVYYLDGFVGGVQRGLDLSSYEVDIFDTSTGGRGPLLRVHELLHLYKLHGSANWRTYASPSSFGATRIVQAATAPTPDDLAVIYPTPSKELDVLGYPYADLLRMFGTTLSVPECALMVVGYGFADEHINRLIFQAMAHNSTLQLFVADPYGVVSPSAVVADGDVERLDTAVGRLSRVPDARIAVLSGDVATFRNVALTLPDVAERTPEQQQELEQALATALLSTPPAPVAPSTPADAADPA